MRVDFFQATFVYSRKCLILIILMKGDVAFMQINCYVRMCGNKALVLVALHFTIFFCGSLNDKWSKLLTNLLHESKISIQRIRSLTLQKIGLDG